MTEPDNKKVLKFLEIAETLKTFKPADSEKQNINLSIPRCSSCGKKLNPSDLKPGTTELLKKIYNNKNITYTDSLCSSCNSEASDYARVVCIRCREVVLRIKPGVIGKNLMLVKNGVYHVEKCSLCDPDIDTVKNKSIQLIEFLNLNKK